MLNLVKQNTQQLIRTLAKADERKVASKATGGQNVAGGSFEDTEQKTCLFVSSSIGQHVQLMAWCKHHFNYNLPRGGIAT